jgi:hypothetical protein
MTVFLSYSSTDKKLADRLRRELMRQGVAVWSDTSLAAGSEWRGRIAEAIRSAEAILVLVGPKGEADEAQRSTWQEALEAVWQDPGKRIVPILVQDAKVPTFVYSADVPFQAVRVDHPQHLEGAARAVARILAPTAKVRGVDADEIDLGIDIVSVKTGYGIESNPAEIEAERAERLSEIRRYAEHLKGTAI